MGARSTEQADVARLRRRLEQWRRRRDRGRRIPDPLWKAAVKLARRDGVSRTALALRLDYYALARRLETASVPGNGQAAAGSEAGGGFVELPLRAAAACAACVLEVEDGRGARLRLELQGLGAQELAGLVSSVWSRPR